jgi:hypothetical protein
VLVIATVFLYLSMHYSRRLSDAGTLTVYKPNPRFPLTVPQDLPAILPML